MAATTSLVTQITGQAWVRGTDGSLTPLHQGMRVPVDADIVTATGASVQLQADGVPPLTIGENRDVQLSAETVQPNVDTSTAAVAAPADPDVAQVLAALNAGDDPLANLDPTAAVLGGGGGDGGSSFTRLVSIVETTTPLGLEYPRGATPPVDTVQFGSGTGDNGDDIDPTRVPGLTTITLEAAPSVTEGGTITYTASVNNIVTGQPLVIELTNGSIITIPVGSNTGTVIVDTRGDDAYAQGDDPLEVGIGGTTGGNYEAIDTTDTTTTVVNDDSDVTTVTLTAPENVVEGGTITYTATVDNPVTGAPLVITLSNGQTITIDVGQSTGTSEPIAARPDDVNVQGETTVPVTITGTTGGNYESLDTSSQTSTTVTDDGDVTTVTLTAPESVVEGGTITYTATVDNPVTGEPLVITLSNGRTITIDVGQSTGTSEPIPARADDLYEQGETTVPVTITGTTGGNYESLDTSSETSTTVTDDNDLVTATLTADTDSVAEGGTITYTVTLTDAEGNEIQAHQDMEFTLANGEKITIAAGETSGTGASDPVPDDLVVGGQPPIENSIEGVTGSDQFENLETAGEPIVAVTDELGTPGNPGDPGTPNQGDAVEVSIAGNGQVTEANSPVFTISIKEALDHNLTVTLSNNQTVVITAGQTSVEYTLPAQGDDVYKDGDTVELGLKDATIGGDALENLTLGDDASVAIVDTIDTVTATLTADPEGSVAEGGTITYTVNLTDADGNPVTAQSDMTFTLANGEVVQIANGATSGSIASLPVADDATQGGQPAIENSIKTVDGDGNFEQVATTGNTNVAVTDEPGTPGNPGDPGTPNQGDAVEVSIAGNGQVTEANSPVFTISIKEALDHNLTVTLSNNQTVVITAGQTSVEYTLPAQGDDVYKDGDTVELGLKDATIGGDALENLTLGDDASVAIVDTIDTVTATLTADPEGSVAEGGTITYTVNLTDADGNPVTAQSDMTFTLANHADDYRLWLARVRVRALRLPWPMTRPKVANPRLRTASRLWTVTVTSSR